MDETSTNPKAGPNPQPTAGPQPNAAITTPPANGPASVAPGQVASDEQTRRMTLDQKVVAMEMELNEARWAVECSTRDRQKVDEENAKLTTATAELETKLAEQMRANSELLSLVKTRPLVESGDGASQIQPSSGEEETRGDTHPEKQAENLVLAHQVEDLEEELRAVQCERDNLLSRLKDEEKASSDLLQWGNDVEGAVRSGSEEREKLAAELKKQIEERASLEAELEVLREAASQSEAAAEENLARSKRAEERLDTVEGEQAAELDKVKREREASGNTEVARKELESKLSEAIEQLKSANQEVEKTVAEKSKVISEAQSLLQRQEKLDKELSALRMGSTNHKVELSVRDRRVRESIGSLARVTTELENERGERRRAEQRATFLSTQLKDLHDELSRQLDAERTNQDKISNYEEALREHEAMIARVSASLQKESAERQLVEEQLKSREELTVRLRQHIALFEQARQVFRRTEAELEGRVQASQKIIGESQEALEKETAERYKLEKALENASNELEQRVQNESVERSKLESALQIEMLERKQVENDLLESRCAAPEQSEVGLAILDRFCAHLHEPLENVMKSTRRLLELKLEEADHQVVEFALEQALLLQASLKESVGEAQSRSSSQRGETPVDSEETTEPKLEP